MSIKRKGITKGEMVQAIKGHTNALNNIYKHLMFVDDILAKFVNFMGKDDEFANYLKELEESEENGEHKQKERIGSRGSSKASK